MATGSGKQDDSSSGFFINISELAEIMNTLERNGVDPEKWKRIGFSLGLYSHTLDQLEFYVQFLESLLRTLEDSAGSIEGHAPHYLWEVLSLWLRRVDRVDERGGATWASLNHSLTRVGDGAAVDRIQREKAAVFRREHDIDDRDLLEKALDNATITTKYTKLSISGLPGSGKSSFLKQLFDEPPHLESAITDLRLIRSSADAREASTKSWERVNYEMLKEMVAIKVSSNTQLISSSTQASSIVPNKSCTISTSSVVLSPLERFVLESLQKELKKLSEELQHQSTKQCPTACKIDPDLVRSHYLREVQQLCEYLQQLRSRKKEQDVLEKESILQSIEEYLLHLSETSHEPCILDQCAFPPSLSLSPPSPPLLRHSLSTSSFPSFSQHAVTAPLPSHCIALDDLLHALATASPSDSNPPHFISAVDTGCLHAVFLEMAAILLGYNSISIVTQRLDEQLDRPVVSYSQDSYTHRQFLESSVRYASFVQCPHLEGLNNPSFSKPCNIILGTYHDHVNSDEPLDAKNSSLKGTLSDFRKSILMKGSSLIFPVNTLARGEVERKLIQGIRQRVCSYYIQAEIPVCWYVFHLELIRQRQTTDILDLSVCVDIGASLKMNPSDVKNALMFYHGVSVILYFPRILPDVVFVNPQIVLDKLADLINMYFDDELTYLERKGINIRGDDFVTFRRNGMYHRNLLEEFQFTDQLTPNFFLHLLEKLLLVLRLSSNASLYFLPSVLPRNTSRDYFGQKSRGKRPVDSLVLKWYGHIAVPQALFPALVASLGNLHGFQVIENRRSSQVTPFPNIFFFQVSENNRFALVNFKETLEVHYKADPSKCAEVKEAIYYSIREVIETYNYDHQLATPKEHFFCFQHKTIDHLCAINDNKEMLTCCEDGTTFPVDLDHQKPWFGDKKVNVLTDSPVAPSVSPEAEESYKRFYRKNNGLLYENSTIIIDVKSDFKGNIGYCHISFWNKSTSSLRNFSGEITIPTELKMDTSPLPQTLDAGAYIQQSMKVECLDVFTEAPVMKISFVIGEVPQAFLIKLPIMLNKYSEGTVMDKTVFSQRWRKLEEFQKIFAAINPIEKKIDKAKLTDFGVSILDDVDPNPDSLVGAFIVNTTNKQVGCLLRLESSSSTKEYRLTLRTSDKSVSKLFVDILSELLF